MGKVLLVSMPFGALGRPALGLSLLKSCLDRSRIACDLRYLTFPFAELIGVEEYYWLSSEVPATAFAGDWTFTAALYGDRPEANRAYLQSVLRDCWQLDETAIARILRACSLVPHVLDALVAQRLMVRDGANYLSLALRAPAPAPTGALFSDAAASAASEYPGERVSVIPTQAIDVSG